MARLDELDGLTEVYPAGHPVLLAPCDGAVYAIDGRCPHRGGPLLQGKLDGCTVRCPWHGFVYDVRDGQPVWPPGWDPVPAYATRIRDGMVELLVSPLG